MAAKGDIRSGMQVIGSDGGMVGRVTGLHDEHMHIEPDAPEPGPGYFVVPKKWAARIDDHVHLDRAAALVRDTWRRETEADAAGRAAAVDRSETRSRKWPWVLGLLLVLALLWVTLAR